MEDNKKQTLFRADGDHSGGGGIAGIIDAVGDAALKTGQGVGIAARGINSRSESTVTENYSENGDGGRGVRIAMIAGVSLVVVAVIVALVMKRRKS